MEGGERRHAAGRPPWLVVADPTGGRSRVAIQPLPFYIGRQSQNELPLRDTRISRTHARIVAENGGYAIEDLQSRNGTFVNRERVARCALNPSDRIDFGVPDSYTLTFEPDEAGIERFAEPLAAAPRPGAELVRLRAVVDLARALESSLSTADLLAALVDSALAITGAERGFLLICRGEDLEFRVARDRSGANLAPEELRVPCAVIQRALARRRELLSMTFDAGAGDAGLPMRTIAELELRSVVCVPLVRLRTAASAAAGALADETLGVIYMDTRAGAADLSSGNRELLQTLAMEASTILENARLLEGERARQRMEEEMKIAREIQSSLLPTALPSEGWFRAAGRSIPSRQVGGDYFDALPLGPRAWAFIVADVSGKGVSAALLAALLQGAFLAAPHAEWPPAQSLHRLNAFLLERTKGEKYATVFLGLLECDGRLRYANAGHGAGLLVRAGGALEPLEATGFPAGLIDEAEYAMGEAVLERGDKLVLYTDGVGEAENLDGELFGDARIRQIARASAGASAHTLFAALDAALEAHTGGALQRDDMTMMTVEYHGDEA